ncbi:MAG TPA: type II secretion system protein GspN [Myxococcota bacterium]|nr:type II secretion system protein GspN [Myxococcota bacterium]
METTRKLRFVLYPCAFALVFIIAAYCTFPKDVVSDLAESYITQLALSLGPKNRGLPEVSFKDASLWRFSGVALKGVVVSWPPKKNQTPLLFELNTLKGRLGIFSLLTGARRYSAEASLYSGDLSVDVKSRKSNFTYLDMEGAKIDLSKMAFVEQQLGAPLQGIFQMLSTLHANTEMTKDGTGSIKFAVENFGYGPGSIKLPGEGMVSLLTVPKLNLGKLQAEFTLDKGQLESKTISLTGGDVEADLKLSVTLGRRPTSSRITGDGWFSVKKELVNTNETLKMLYDLLPVLRAAQQGDGKAGLIIRGNLARPDISLETYTKKNP